MRIGIGIDTGGTCTDGVIYDLEHKTILDTAKTPTTRENLAVGIGNALDQLSGELLKQAEVVALSTTLATNACVENKGGRGKLIFLGMEEENVRRVGKSFGLPMEDGSLIFIPCKETLQGEILEEPDWAAVEQQLQEELRGCQAVGIVELFASGTGGALEKKTRDIVEKMNLPAVCGYELFQEKNVIGRGAGALLNARLIFVIAEFLKAVREALALRHLEAPVVIVRSDGSRMSEEFSKKRPIETLLCGPVASVMGAAELHCVADGVVIDMGGTTTDISIVEGGAPVRSQDGITVGDWTIYVHGMFVDTFGLGGDSEVLLSNEGRLSLGGCRIMPLSMAAARFPHVKELLEEERRQEHPVNSWRRHIYVGLRDISGQKGFSSFEMRVAAAFYQNPLSLEELEKLHGISLIPASLNRLVQEGILIRCGITPTDAMHVLGDYRGYDTEAAEKGMATLALFAGRKAGELAREIYGMVEKKLYCNVVRVLLLHQYPALSKRGLGRELELVIEGMYDRAREGCTDGFFRLAFTCQVPLIGVGGPIGVFLGQVASLLGTRALLGPYAGVANALGAVVGNVEVVIDMEILPNPEKDDFRVFGNGEAFYAESLEEARQQAQEAARRLAEAEALRRGAVGERLRFSVEAETSQAPTAYGDSIFLGERMRVRAFME